MNATPRRGHLIFHCPCPPQFPAELNLPHAGETSVRALRRVALNTNGRATNHGFYFANVIGRARCRSLSPLNAASRTPSQVSFNVTPGVRTLALARGADGFSRSDDFISIHPL